MSIRLAPDIEAKINKRVERGHYPDADAVVEEALRVLEARDRKETLRALIQEGLDDIERGDVIEMTPTFWDEIMAEADEEDRLGIPIPDHVKP